jgi:hypothetical protein
VIAGAGDPPGPLDEYPPPPRPPWSAQPPAPAPDPPWDATTGTGMSAVYFANSTFGSLGDYLSIALWGSTATAGTALVRRLFPGAFTTGI